MKRKYWAYLHSNGQIITKRWTGDHGDYTTDCEGNDFVVMVVKPFEAENWQEALTHAGEEIHERSTT